MRSKLLIIGLALLSGCTLFGYKDFRYYPEGSYASMLVSYQYISRSTTEVIYDINVASFSYYNDIYYDPSNYKFEGPGTFNIVQIEGVEKISNNTSANIILVDQSGSYIDIDPHDFRTKALNKFLEDFSPQGSVLLGGFSVDGLMTQQPVQYDEQGFTSSWINRDFLFELPKETGGNSSLFDAIASSVNQLSQRSENQKNIFVLAHANDASSTATITDLVTQAAANSIHIHFIMLGISPTEVWDIAQPTNGMLAYCLQDLDMLTIFQHLEKLINGTVYTSRVRVSFKPNSGIVTSGDIYENQIRISDKTVGYDLNPIFVKIKVP